MVANVLLHTQGGPEQNPSKIGMQIIDVLNIIIIAGWISNLNSKDFNYYAATIIIANGIVLVGTLLGDAVPNMPDLVFEYTHCSCFQAGTRYMRGYAAA